MKPFRFIHAADLHLDSPFTGLSGIPAGIRKLLRESGFMALQRLVELAVSEKVDFVLFAGDVYDSADRSLRAQVRFQSALKQLGDHGIQAFVVYGNHDPADGRSAGLQWPETVVVFPPDRVERAEVHLSGRGHVADVLGISYPTAAVKENYALRFKEFEPLRQIEGKLVRNGVGRENTPYRIGLLHTNVDGASEHANYAPCTLSDLLDAGMDYWALGHVHTRQIMNHSPYVVYPGNIQGRHIREPGAKGCYLVDVNEGGEAKITFCPLDVVRWSKRQVSITGLAEEQELKELLEQTLEEERLLAAGRAVMLRVELVGRGPIHRRLTGGDLLELVEELRQSEAERYRYSGGNPGSGVEAVVWDTDLVWVESMVRKTGAEIQLEPLLASSGFLGDLLRFAEEQLEDPGKLQAVAEEWLKPLLNNPKAGGLLRHSGLVGPEGIDPAAAAEWMEQAREWILDQLIDEEGEAG